MTYFHLGPWWLAAVAVAIGIVTIVGGLVVNRLSRRAQRMAAS